MMSRFYGVVRGNRGEATRGGSARSGMTTYCASWSGAICCRAYINQDEEDCVRVTSVDWPSKGTRTVLYDGPMKGRQEDV